MSATCLSPPAPQPTLPRLTEPTRSHTNPAHTPCPQTPSTISSHPSPPAVRLWDVGAGRHQGRQLRDKELVQVGKVRVVLGAHLQGGDLQGPPGGRGGRGPGAPGRSAGAALQRRAPQADHGDAHAPAPGAEHRGTAGEAGGTTRGTACRKSQPSGPQPWRDALLAVSSCAARKEQPQPQSHLCQALQRDVPERRLGEQPQQHLHRGPSSSRS